MLQILDECNKHVLQTQGKERVTQDRDDLGYKRAELIAFMGTDAFEKLDHAETRRLQRQEWLMAQLVEVLNERIAAF